MDPYRSLPATPPPSPEQSDFSQLMLKKKELDLYLKLSHCFATILPSGMESKTEVVSKDNTP